MYNNSVAEPPSPRLQSAAQFIQDFPLLEQDILWLALGSVALLLLSLLFSVVLSTVSRRLSENRQEAPGQLEQLASLQLGRSLTAFSFVTLAVLPLSKAFLAVVPAPLAFVLALLLLACLYVLFVLQLGKLLADARGEAVFARLRWPVRAWQTLSYPLNALVVLVGRSLQGWTGIRMRDPAQQALQLRQLLEEDAQEGGAQPERQLLRNVLEFTGATAGDMMMPRPDVVWISTEESYEAVLEQMRQSGHTRFPLCEETPDRVIGYLHAKDLTLLRSLPTAAPDWRKLARPVAFVPESARAMTLLERFQQDRSHMAVVVDEFGGMAGIITLEDLLEELVGEIQDEFDAEEVEIQALEDGDLLVDGGVHLDELEERLGLTFGDVEEETLGGYIFGRLAREVQPGEEVQLHNATLRVVAVEGLRVTQVRIQFQQEPAEAPEAGDASGEVATLREASLK